ncbi:hypothetical protein [Aliidiomarina quisquiliarum]|uniref:hypothetical protein n=1 Tax=Aliidiomarina quisquiliarum TaxID=2938947 RepID=UPI00208FA54A|nr:hypothetical protein [Aliidiomarina quisquiliarum]MCO4322564.1 hypothetical protein [Aliidiomarina quisquiliarum]
MNYLICVILPPYGIWLSGYRKQAMLSLPMYMLAITLLYVAFNGGPPGSYVAGPVIYVVAIIHAFIFTHRYYQKVTGKIHPHENQ